MLFLPREAWMGALGTARSQTPAGAAGTLGLGSQNQGSWKSIRNPWSSSDDRAQCSWTINAIRRRFSSTCSLTDWTITSNDRTWCCRCSRKMEFPPLLGLVRLVNQPLWLLLEHQLEERLLLWVHLKQILLDSWGPNLSLNQYNQMISELESTEESDEEQQEDTITVSEESASVPPGGGKMI